MNRRRARGPESAIPEVHPSVKKRDMVFEYVLIGILVAFLVYILLDTMAVFPNFLSKFRLTSIAGTCIALYALVWQLHSAIKASKVLVSIKLSTDVDGGFVKITCSITNTGTKSIYPYLTNLYINEGIEIKGKKSVNEYKFEPLTEHRISRDTGECFDCKIAEFCKSKPVGEKGKIVFPECESAEFLDTIRYCCNIRQLSYYSLVHIMPGETFTEDVVLNIEKPGVYRAFVIYTGKEWDDCICTTQIFRIKGGLT